VGVTGNSGSTSNTRTDPRETVGGSEKNLNIIDQDNHRIVLRRPNTKCEVLVAGTGITSIGVWVGEDVSLASLSPNHPHAVIYSPTL
jgi:hypothetical protein